MKKLEKWLDVEFESSTTTTEQFKKFSREIRSYLKNIDGFELVDYSRGHFYFSAFLKNKVTGKYVYVSSDDVRYSVNGWYNCLLVRTAEHEKDYTGGSNCFTDLETVGEKLNSLTK